ncbi:MAG: Gfo/Idh/MocA family oxidoreductase [Gemmatimonadota bacterium]
MSAPRVVIAGAGLMGRWHAYAAHHAGAIVVAVADPQLGRAQAIAGSDALATRTLADALETTPDIVHVCAPLDTHMELCHQALAAGCHVIVEKPVSPTAHEAAELVQAASAAARTLTPVHQFICQEGVRQIMARRGALGPIRHLEFATCSAGADGRDDRGRDLVAAEIAPHAFSLARALLDIDVGDLTWRLDRAGAGEWTFSAVTAAGTTIMSVISLRARPTFATCRVLGEGGSALADLFQGFATFEPATASCAYKVIRPVAVGLEVAGTSLAQLTRRALRGERAYPGLRALCADTYRAIAGGGPAPFRATEVADVAEARDQLLRQVIHSS